MRTGAIKALTRGLAVEPAPQRIRVNTARAGSTDTALLRRHSPRVPIRTPRP
jgi:NAD(P)-dependent dehydrogenase (short-subunit alcohol dehydrogenase family)